MDLVSVDGCIYESLSFLREGEESVTSRVVAERAQEMGANLDEEEGRYFVANYRGQEGDVFVFAGWQSFGDGMVYVVWFEDNWILHEGDRPDDDWYDDGRLLRLKQESGASDF